MRFYQNVQHSAFVAPSALGHANNTVFLTPVWIENPIRVREVWTVLEVVAGSRSACAIYQLSKPQREVAVSAVDSATLANEPLWELVATAEALHVEGGRARYRFAKEAVLDPGKQYAVAWVVSDATVGISTPSALDVHYAYVCNTLAQLGLTIGSWPRLIKPLGGGIMYAGCFSLISDQGLRALAR